MGQVGPAPSELCSFLALQEDCAGLGLCPQQLTQNPLLFLLRKSFHSFRKYSFLFFSNNSLRCLGCYNFGFHTHVQ